MQADVSRAVRMTVLGAAVFGFLTHGALVAAPLLILRMLAVPFLGLTVVTLHLATTELVESGRLTRVQQLVLTAVLMAATVAFWWTFDRLVGPSR